MHLCELLTGAYNKKNVDCTRSIFSVMITTPQFSFMTKENVQREQKKGAEFKHHTLH
jgi:hypothetical protein